MPTKRILVIESDEAFSQSLISMFASYDVELTVITDGKDGLQAAKDESPALILLCVELPKMSGYSICNKLKKDKELKSIPLIIMSAEATEETFLQHQKLKTRADEYIIKPFDIEQILKKVTLFIDLPRKAGEEELITIDDDEAIAISEDEAIVIDDLPDLEDEKLDLPGEDATMVAESPGSADELEKFEEAFDDLQVGGEPSEPTDLEAQVPAAPAAGDDLAEINDMLDSLEEEERKAATEALAKAEQRAAAAPEPEEDFKISEDEEIPGLEEGESAAPQADDELQNVLDQMGSPGELDALSASDAEPGEQLEQLKEGDDLSALDAEVFSPEAQPAEPAYQEVPAGEPAAEPYAGPYAGPQGQQSQPQGRQSQPAAAPATAAPRSLVGAAPGADPVLTTKLQIAEEQNRHLRDKVTKLESRLEEAHQAYEKRESELSGMKRDTSKDKEFLVLKTTLNTKDREILDLKEELNRKDQEILDVKEKVGERDEELGRLQETVVKRDREIKEMSDRFDTLLKQKNELEETLQAKMTEWQERYTNDITRLEHQVRSLKDEHAKALQEADKRLKTAEANTSRLQTTLDDTKQRHSDEVFGLRTRYKNEIDKVEGERNSLQAQLEQTQKQLDEETTAHNATKEDASRIPKLEEDLGSARDTIVDLEQKSADLQSKLTKSEERVVKAYKKIKDDEKIKEKARKAVEIAFTLLADQVATEEGEGEQPAADQDDATP